MSGWQRDRGAYGRTRWAALALAVALAGCASAGGSGVERNDEPVSGGELTEYTNILLALESLRPTWARSAREVFIDGEYLGSTGVLRRAFAERISYVELVPSGQVVRRFGPCQAPAGTGTLDTPRDPQCGTRPVIHIVRYAGE